jgi:uncharacterized protein
MKSITRFIGVLVLTSTQLLVLGQTRMANQIISEGAAKLKVKPDLGFLTLKIDKMDTSESKSMQNLNKEIQTLINSLNSIGFSNKSIKISDYGIANNEIDHQKTKYIASCTLAIEFKLDDHLLNSIFNKMQAAEFRDLDISFETELSDSLEKETRTRLYRVAIEDAKFKAKIFSNALDLTLGRVTQVSKYGSPAYDVDKAEAVAFTPPKVIRDYDDVSLNKAPFDKLQVSSVELEENITLVFEILN